MRADKESIKITFTGNHHTSYHRQRLTSLKKSNRAGSAVTNMVPKTIAGITSEAMLLAADVDGVPFWLTPNGQVPDGTLIK